MLHGIAGRMRRWLRWRIGLWLSRLGERLGIQWLTYNPLHFYSFHAHALTNAPIVMSAITDAFPDAKRYLDIGAGSGAFAAEATRLGKTVVALEHNAAGRRLARAQGVHVQPFDLASDSLALGTGSFEIAYCFEVAEHLPPNLGDRLVAFAAESAPIVIFTAAPPGQTGTGHINEQPQQYWITRFEQSGMRFQPHLSKRLSEEFRKREAAPWFTQNVMVFER